MACKRIPAPSAAAAAQQNQSITPAAEAAGEAGGKSDSCRSEREKLLLRPAN